MEERSVTFYQFESNHRGGEMGETTYCVKGEAVYRNRGLGKRRKQNGQESRHSIKRLYQRGGVQKKTLWQGMNFRKYCDKVLTIEGKEIERERKNDAPG